MSFSFYTRLYPLIRGVVFALEPIQIRSTVSTYYKYTISITKTLAHREFPHTHRTPGGYWEN